MNYVLCSMKRDGVNMPHLNENYKQGKVKETYSHEPIYIFDADSTVNCILRFQYNLYLHLTKMKYVTYI